MTRDNVNAIFHLCLIAELFFLLVFTLLIHGLFGMYETSIAFFPKVWVFCYGTRTGAILKATNSLQILMLELWFQILLDDVKVTEQLLDLAFYLLIVLGGYKQVFHNPHLLRSITCITYMYWDLLSWCRKPVMTPRSLCIQQLWHAVYIY